MDREEVEPSACNGEMHSTYGGSKVEGSDKEEAEEEEDEEETNALLTTKAINGCLRGKMRPESARRKVQWNDHNGDKLADVVEFDPSDSSDSEDDLNHEITKWEQVITSFMNFCCCPSNQRSRT